MSQATPFDLILTQCRDLFSERMSTALAGMLDESDEALVAMSNETRDPKEQKLYRELREKLLAQRATIESQFKMLYLREFQQRSNSAKKIGDEFDDIDLSEIELALVGEDDLNETLKFNAMSAKLRRYCEEELVALDQRVGVLFGDAELEPEDNPFAPEAISDAYKQACAQVDTNVDARLAMLRLFDEFVLDEIRGIYRAVNALLVQNAILPKLRGVSFTRKKEAEKPAKPKDAEQDLFALLQKMVAANPAPAAPGAGPGTAAAGGGAPQVLQAADLLRTLTRVQHGDAGVITGGSLPPGAIVTEAGTTNVLHGLKESDLGSGMSQMDAMTLDIVALLFDQLFDDPKIPISVKGLIGRLQIPMLKVAIADKEFFSRKTHPARGMLDTLGEVAARLPEDVSADHPTFAKMEEILQGLLASFEDNVEIFDTVGELLEELIADADQRIEEQSQVAEQQIEQQETLALAKTVAQTQIKLRTRASELPESVVEFLFRQWIKVLLLIQVKEGERSETWTRALETMDLLIWSVEPKNTRDERREMVGKVPDLLKRLSEALNYAGIEDEVRTRLFGDLRKLHSEMLAGGSGASAAAPEGVSPSPEPAAQEEIPAAEPAQADALAAGVDTQEAPAAPTASVEESAAAPEALEFEAATESAAAELPPAAEAEAGEAGQMPAPAADDGSLRFEMAEADATRIDPSELEKTETEQAELDAAEDEAAPAPVSADAPLAFELPDLESSPAPAQTTGPESELPDAAAEPAPEAAAEAGTALEFPTLETGVAPTPAPEASAPAAAAPAAKETKAPLEFSMTDSAAAPAPDKPAAAGEAPEAKETQAPLEFSMTESAAVPAPDKPAAASEAPAAKETKAPLEFSMTDSAAVPVPDKPAPKESKAPLEFPKLDLGTAPAPKESKPSPETPKPDTAASPPSAPDRPPLSFELPVLDIKPEAGAAPAIEPPAAAKKADTPAQTKSEKPAAPGAAAPGKAPGITAAPVKALPTAAVPPKAAPGAAAPVKPAAAKAPPVAAAPAKAVPPATPPLKAAAPAAPAAAVKAPPAKQAPAKAAPARAAAVDLSAPVTVNNPFGEGEVQVDDLDFTVQLGGSAKGSKPVAGLPGNLSLGAWVEIRQKEDKNARRVAKLNFVSPLKTRFLFVDRHGKTVLECSQAALVRLMSEGDVKPAKAPAAEAPLFDRLAEGVASKLAERR